MVDSFLNHHYYYYYLILYNNAPHFLELSSWIGAGLRHPFYLYFKPDLIMQSSFTPKPTNDAPVHAQYQCSMHPKKEDSKLYTAFS